MQIIPEFTPLSFYAKQVHSINFKPCKQGKRGCFQKKKQLLLENPFYPAPSNKTCTDRTCMTWRQLDNRGLAIYIRAIQSVIGLVNTASQQYCEYSRAYLPSRDRCCCKTLICVVLYKIISQFNGKLSFIIRNPYLYLNSAIIFLNKHNLITFMFLASYIKLKGNDVSWS